VDNGGRLGVSGYLKNSSLNAAGYEPMRTIRQLRLNARAMEMIGNVSFDFNVKTQKIYYRDTGARQIRYV